MSDDGRQWIGIRARWLVGGAMVLVTAGLMLLRHWLDW